MGICFSDMNNRLVMLNNIDDIRYGMIGSASGSGLIITDGKNKYGCVMTEDKADRYLKLAKRQMNDNPNCMPFLDIKMSMC